MNRLVKKLFACFCAAIVLVSLSAHAWAYSLSFDPIETEIGVEDTFGIDVVIAGLEADNLAEFSLNVIFDESILDFESLIFGSELGDINSGEADNWSLPYLEDGIIDISELSYLPTSAFQSQPDEFVLLSIIFVADSLGISPLTFSDIVLGNEMGESLDGPLTLEEGSVTTHEVAAGDVDDSGDLDLRDAILSLQIISKMSLTESVHKGADVNGDKRIGLEETVYILQKVAELRNE